MGYLVRYTVTVCLLLVLLAACIDGACEPGTFKNGTNCTTCPVNTYQDEEAKYSCKSCDAGKYTLHQDSRMPLDHNSVIKCVINTSTLCPFDAVNNVFLINKSCEMGGTFVVGQREVIVVGVGSNIKLTSSGRGRIFKVESGGILLLENVTLSARRDSSCGDDDGMASCNNGGVFVESNASLFATQVTFTENHHLRGGALYGNESSEIVLENCTLHHNYAYDKGAAIFIAQKSSLAIDDCKFNHNKLFYYYGLGAAIYAENNVAVVVTNSAFEDNKVLISSNLLQYANGRGGAIYSGPFSTISFTSCNFQRNIATKGGVAYIGTSSNISFTKCTFRSNNATKMAGAVYLKSNGVAVFDECTAVGNSVTGASAAYVSSSPVGQGGVHYFEELTSVTMSDSLFENNTAQGGGGCINLKTNTIALKLTNVIFRTNEAGHSGGAIHRDSSGVTNPPNVIIDRCRFIGNKAGTKNEENKMNGGAIAFAGFTKMMLKDTEFDENYSPEGGGALYIARTTSVYIAGSSFTRNKGRDGGAVFADKVNSFLSIAHTTFDGNNAMGTGGGGAVRARRKDFYAYAVFVVIITDCQFKNNIASDGASYGGGARIDGYFGYYWGWRRMFLNIELSNSSFVNNTAGYIGGGVYVNLAKVQASSLIFKNNKALSGRYSSGGGAHFTNGNHLTSRMENCTFVENQATRRGFAVQIIATSMEIVNSVVHANFARIPTDGYDENNVEGGAVYVAGLIVVNTQGAEAFAQSVMIYESTFSNNVGKLGSAIYFDGPRKVQVKRCNFTRNIANESGGGLYVKDYGEIEVTSSRFTENYAFVDGGAAAVFDNSKLTFLNPTHTEATSSVLLRNKAKGNGGAIFVGHDGGKLIMTSKNAVKWWHENDATVGGGICYLSKEPLTHFHASNFPTNNTAVLNGSNLWAHGPDVKPVEMICEPSTYYPLQKWRFGISFDVWNLEGPLLLDALCPRCASGKTSKEGDLQCEPCERGRAGTNGICDLCAMNTYQDNYGSTTCKDCEPGYFTKLIGETGCIAAPKPCPPSTPLLELEDPIVNGKPLSLQNIKIFWNESSESGGKDCNKGADEYVIEISTHKSFTNSGGDELYRINVYSGDIRSASLRLKQRLSDKKHFVRVRAKNKTNLASSDWSISSEDYTSADTCGDNQYLNISSLSPNPMLGGVEKWKCDTCMAGASCTNKTATVATILPVSKNLFSLVGIKGKFGYWRSNKIQYTFKKCPFPPACLGAKNMEFIGQYLDKDGNDPALKDHNEVCNSESGYRENCTIISPTDEIKSTRCRLCTSCSANTRRGYASPKCKGCPAANILWVVLACLAMVIVFSILLRISLSRSGKKQQSSHQRRLILSYMQMTALLSTIGIRWPEQIYVMFEIQSAASTVGDHVLKLDCIIPNLQPQTLVYVMQIGYALCPFVAVIAIFLFVPCCAFKLKKKTDIEGIQTRKNMTIKGVVLLLYMAYPSLVRQSFVLWHCIGIGGRCVNDADGSIDVQLGNYACAAKDGYRWEVDSEHGYGDFLFMATELRCWSGTHTAYLILVGVPHIFLYIFGLPILALLILNKHRKNGKIRSPEVLFCYGLLYDGYKDTKWWWQGVIASAKTGITFVSYWWAANPIMAMLFANFIFTVIMLFELLARPWARSETKRVNPNATRKRRRQSLADLLVSTVETTLKELNLAQFSAMSLFLCSLTGWTGLYFSLSPECKELLSRSLSACVVFTFFIIALHIGFVIWGLRAIFKTKLSELKANVKKKSLGTSSAPRKFIRALTKSRTEEDVAPPNLNTNPLFERNPQSQAPSARRMSLSKMLKNENAQRRRRSKKMLKIMQQGGNAKKKGSVVSPTTRDPTSSRIDVVVDGQKQAEI
jgi:hypothetical protein